MKIIYYSLLLALITVLSSLQMDNNDLIDPKNLDELRLEKLILDKINVLRSNKSVETLKLDSILALAAKDHSLYIGVKNKLSHTQSQQKKRLPINRVEYYGGKYKIVGENVAFTYCNKSVNNAQFKTKTEVITTYSQLANHFFWLWKNSKPHYSNMMNKEYSLGSIRFFYDETTHKVFAVQVFGVK